MKFRKHTATIITALIFSLISYSIMAFTAWSIDLREWHPFLRFLWIIFLVLPLNNYTKKYVQI